MYVLLARRIATLLHLPQPPPGGFSHHIEFKPNLAGRNYVSKGTDKKIWALVACVAPPGRDFFVCLYVASPFDTLRTEKTADFGVESHDPTANLCPSSKIPDFFTPRRRGIEKGRFSRFLRWVFCRSATAYIEHQIYTQKVWIISGDVVDVPFGGNRCPTNNGTPMGDHQPPKNFDPKICFLWPIRCRKIR